MRGFGLPQETAADAKGKRGTSSINKYVKALASYVTSCSTMEVISETKYISLILQPGGL